MGAKGAHLSIILGYPPEDLRKNRPQHCFWDISQSKELLEKCFPAATQAETLYDN